MRRRVAIFGTSRKAGVFVAGRPQSGPHVAVGLGCFKTFRPEYLENWLDKDNPVRAIDAFVDKVDLCGLGFDGVTAEETGRPSFHSSALLKLYIYEEAAAE